MRNISKYQKIIFEKSTHSKNIPDITKSYSYLGDYYSNTSKKDSAFSFYTKVEKLFVKLNDNLSLGTVYVNMAIVQSYENDFLGSELSAVKH